MKIDGVKSDPSRERRRLSFYKWLENGPLANGNQAENMQWIQPRPQDDLDRRHNFNCEVCLIHGSSSDDLLRCIYCNVICHLRCLQKFFRRAQFDPYWICFYCVDYLDNSRVIFEDEKRSQSNYHKQKLAQISIAKHWRRFAARKHYLRIYMFVVRMQVMFHVRRRKRMFIQTLQAKLRPMKLRIMRCYGLVSATGDRHTQHKASNASLAPLPGKSHLKPLQSHSHATASGAGDIASANGVGRRRDSSFYILVTCMDHSKAVAVQSLRMPSRLISLDISGHAPFDLVVEERMLLPGVSGFSVLVFSVLQRGASKDFLLGQCSLDLSAEHVWKCGGHFRLALGEQEYAIKDPIGMDMKTDARLRPTGSLEFDLLAFHGMTSECGYCYATNPDDLVRALARLPDCRGFSVPHRSALAGPVGHGKGGGHGDGSASRAMGSSDSFAIAMKKVWIAIAEGQLYVYSHFGDPLRLALEIAAFTHHFEYKEHGRVLVYRLRKAGYPDFVFHTAAAQDALRWKCAFLCSARLFGREAVGGGGSGGSGGLDGFDMAPLLQDLWMLEALKPHSPLIREAQQALLAQQQQAQAAAGMRKTVAGAVKEATRMFAAAVGGRQSQLVRRGEALGTGQAVPPPGRPTLRGSALLPVLAAQRLSSLATPASPPSPVQPVQPVQPVKAPAPAPPLAPQQQQQQLFLAVGAQMLSDRIREISVLDDVVTNEKYQRHGERLVKYMLTSIAEKKQRDKRTRGGDGDLLADYGITPEGHSRDD